MTSGRKKIVILGFVIILLAIIGVFLLSVFRLDKINPTVSTMPQSKSSAVEPRQNPCKVSFSIIIHTPTPTPSGEMTASSDQKAASIQTMSPTPNAPVCNAKCLEGNNGNDCPVDMTCYQGRCRNPICFSAVDCRCPLPSITPTPTKAAAAACQGICTITADCVNGLSCENGVCVNPACMATSTCVCSAITPTVTTAGRMENAAISPTLVVAQPVMPEAGTYEPTLFVIFIGCFSLCFGAVALRRR